MNDNNPLTIDNVRDHILGLDAQVPLLDGSHRQYINFDNAASSPALEPVHAKVTEFMTWYSSIHRGTGFKSQIATDAYDLAHDLVGCFLCADPTTHTVILGKNTTEAINKLAHRFPFEPGDIVLSSLMEHHSNDLPWRQVARVEHIRTRLDGTLDEDHFDDLLRQHGGKVKLVAVTGASNASGCLTPIHRMAEKAHAVGAMILVDAAQLAPHRPVNMFPTDDPGHLDFVVLSAHKMYAPYGTGVLVGPTAVFEQGIPDQVGGGTVNMVTEKDIMWNGPPDREEAGSPNVIGAVALAQAILCLQEIGMDAIARHEAELTTYTLRRLREIEGLRLYGLADPEQVDQRVGVIPFTLEGIDHYKVAAVLSFEGGIGVRNGYFCAHPYATRLLGISGDEAVAHQKEIRDGSRTGLPGIVRIGFGCYNNQAEVDHLIEMLQRIVAGEIEGDYERDPVSAAYWPRGYQPDYDRYFNFKPGLKAAPRSSRWPACGA